MAAPHPTLLDEHKRLARIAASARRGGCDPALGAALSAHLLRSGLIPAGSAVAGFWPLPGEIDLRPLLHALHAAGHPVLLPHTPARGQLLSFRRWTPEAPMLPGRFGTLHPDGAEAVPDLLLVPLLAFDDTGARLGYGGGYYDRTLAGLPGRAAIGCAFAAQLVDAVPAGPHDIPLHAVATERGVHRFRT